MVPEDAELSALIERIQQLSPESRSIIIARLQAAGLASHSPVSPKPNPPPVDIHLFTCDPRN